MLVEGDPVTVALTQRQCHLMQSLKAMLIGHEILVLQMRMVNVKVQVWKMTCGYMCFVTSQN